MTATLPALFFALLLAQIYLFWPSGADREAAEWREFFLLGSLFPALVVGAALAARKIRRPAAAWLAIGGATAVLAALAWKAQPSVLSIMTVTAAALVQFVVFLGARRLVGGRGAAGAQTADAPSPEEPRTSAAARFLGGDGFLLLPMLLTWGSAATFLHWFPTLPVFLQRYSPWSIAVLIASFALSCLAVLGTPRPGGLGFRRVIDAAAVVCFFLFSFNYGRQPMGLLSFHWSSYAGGPIDLIRLGGRLLWDVPSSYGFLSILSVAALDTPTGWDSLYLVMGVFLFAVALLIYAIFRLATRTTWGALLAFFLVPGVMFLLSGQAPLMSGPYHSPSTSAYRFGWPMLIMALGVLYSLRSRGSALWEKWLLVVGSLLLTIGLLWSFETGIYCGGAFGPLYLVFLMEIFRKETCAGIPRRQAYWRAAAWAATPLVPMAAAWGGITAYYLWDIGHAPDWRMHIEYATGFQGGYGAVNIQIFDPVWAVVLVFAVLGAAFAWVLRTGAERRALAALASSFFATWAMTSWYVGRSTSNIVTMMSPHWILALAAVWAVLRGREDFPLARRWLAPVLVPYFTVLLAITYGYVDGLRNRDVASTFIGPWSNAHAAHEPFKPNLEPMLQEAGIGVGGNVVILDGTGMPPPTVRTIENGREVSRYRVIQWFPAGMVFVLDVLPVERRAEIVRRYLRRVRMGGWVAYRADLISAFMWVDDVLLESHRVTNVLRGRGWVLVRYEPRP